MSDKTQSDKIQKNTEPTSRRLNHPVSAVPVIPGFAPVAARGAYRLMEATDAAAHQQLRTFIGEQFRIHFGADVPDDTRRLLGVFGPEGELAAAFGIRTRADGFFSEHYLGGSLDAALFQKTGERIDAERVVEISHFSIASPKVFARIVPLLAEGLALLHFDHVVCTATRCLVRYFARRYLTPTILTEARAADLPAPVRECWGSYYLKDPAVAFGHLSGVLTGSSR